MTQEMTEVLVSTELVHRHPVHDGATLSAMGPLVDTAV